MFINEFNKRESIIFINLVQALANADEVFANSEQILIDDYIKELSLNNETIEKLTYESAIEELSSSTDRIKNILYFELLGLALADGSYDEKEIKLLDNIAYKLNIDNAKQQDFINYFKMTKNVNDFITMNPECKIKLLKETAMDLI
jgi:tellurite resistance protein